MAKLSRGDGSNVQDPSPAQVVTALQEVIGSEGDFAILDTQKGFIQAAEYTGGGMVLEYKLIDSNTLHRIAGRSVSVQEAAEAFERFRRGDMAWTSKYEWETEEMAGSGRGAGCLGVLMLLLVTVAAVWAM